MGNFHCITSTCGEVRYKRYEKNGGIRYRYPGGDWVTVDGDDYEVSMSDDDGTCQHPDIKPNVGFEITFNKWNGGTFRDSLVGEFGSKFDGISFSGSVIRATFSGGNSGVFVHEKNYQFGEGIREVNNVRQGYRNRNGSNVDMNQSYNRDFYCQSREECNFTVFKNGEIIHQETRPECPEVEQSNNNGCRKSDRVEIVKVEKEAYLQRIEVRNQDIQAYGIGGLLIDASPLPGQCLNIYRTSVTAPPFLSNFVPTAAIFNPYEFVAQICSDPDCPPPEYEVICDCEGEECPDGTCAVICGSHVCCHNTAGQAVHQIPIENYRGDIS